MKLTNLFMASCSMLLLLGSCVKDDCKRVMTYTKYEPIYKSYDEIRVDPTVERARDLKNPGKIYLYGSLLLINEIDEGVHVIDNANPSAPNSLAFIAIPGNVDIAMSGNILYADNYVDLLAIDMTDIQNISLKKRVNNIFPHYGADPDKGILVKYSSEEVTEEVDCSVARENQFFEDMLATGGGMNTQNQNLAGSSGGSGGTGGGREANGIGGSMARFTISGQNLYIVDNQNLQIFDITTADNPYRVSQVQVGWGIETIFPYNDKLFIGSNTGMFIYDNSNPQNPTYLSEFQHANSCDPVFVEGNFAYVTLRSGTECQGFNNQLDVVDISNITNPTLVSSTNFANPHGLSVENDRLYLCDGADGLKVHDVSNKHNIANSQLFHNPSISAFDAISIPNVNVLLVVGEDGFYQYNTSTPSALQLLSHIPVVQ